VNGNKTIYFSKKNIDLNGKIYWKEMFLELFYDTQEG